MKDSTRTEDSPPPWLAAVVDALAKFADVHIPWAAKSKVESLVSDLLDFVVITTSPNTATPPSL